MTIANKIILLIFLLLTMMSANTWISVQHMSQIRSEFTAMIVGDQALTEAVTSIHQWRLKKNVLLERLIGVCEELGFEQMPFARKQYLMDELKNIENAMAGHISSSGQEHLRARNLIDAALRSVNDPAQAAILNEVNKGLDRLEENRVRYDALTTGILKGAQAGGFELSLENLEDINVQQNSLSKDVEDVLKRVQSLTRLSLNKAKEWEQNAQNALVVSIVLTAFIAFVLALWIVRSIVKPLGALQSAAIDFGRGQLNVRLDTRSRDELADVAAAFNTMAMQLEEVKARLEQQNKDLKETHADLDRFINVMVHDIANPLTVMIASCAYLEQHAGPQLSPKSLEALQGIRKSSTKMHQMVKDLLQFAKSKRPQNQTPQLNLPPK